ncbi:MAG: hypothetical protein HKN45_08715 [Flavobacteriales bacterium]|nr:hypothetical protein [Flavobacteriales bacterium]
MKYLLSIPLVVLCFIGHAQNSFDSYWHFGDSLALNFTSGSPVIETSGVQVGSSTEPASLSDGTGNLLLYTDGDILYNSEGDTVVNGVFDDTAIENIFSPIPGDEQRFYLFRYSEFSNNVTWSIIDLSDGIGFILDEEKDVEFYNRQCQLMVTSHANQIDRWLIVADNNGGEGGVLNFTTYLINNTGFSEVSTFQGSYIFAGWYETLEEARMSPNCTRIATSHKGHYVTLFEFDNETGEVDTGFNNAANLPDSFVNLNYIDFSPSGEYLYVLRDESTVIRYNAETLNETDFLNSEESIVDLSEIDYSHIKRGPDGNMYLLSSQELRIDIIEDPDESEPIYLTEFLDLPGDFARFFPNTVNSCSVQPLVLVNSVCEGDTTFFSSFLGTEMDSLYWVISSSSMDNDTVFTSIFFSDLFPEPDIYTVDLYYLFDTIWYELNTEFTVFEQPVVELGEDISACEGDEIELDAAGAAFGTLWSTGESTPRITVTQTANYSVTLINGLCSAFDDIDVSFTQLPVSDIEDVIICNEVIPVTLDASGQHIDEYLWLDGTTESQLIVDSNGVYEVTVSNECFSSLESAEVIFVLFPESLVDSLYEVCGSDTLEVSSSYTFGTIEWSNGQVGPITYITGQGDFTVNIEHFGCFYSDQFFVERIPYVDAGQLIMPNVASFNEDELNDVFRPFVPWDPTLDVCTYETLSVDMKVYNRWGNLVLDGDCRWFGDTDAGDPVPEGVYYYLIDIESNCLDKSSEAEKTGFLEAFE